MRLIDADKLLDRLKDWRGDKEDLDLSDPRDIGYFDGMSKAIRFTCLSHTIDAVPVVRCKDCVHSAKLEGYHQRRLKNGLNCNACRGDNGYGIAKLSLTTPDGYCDYGLRRSSDANE